MTTVADAPDPDGSLLSCLAWAIDNDAISSSQAAMLARVYSPAPGQPTGHAAVAQEYGIPVATLRQRCSRAAKAVAAAVQRHAEGDSLHLAS